MNNTPNPEDWGYSPEKESYEQEPTEELTEDQQYISDLKEHLSSLRYVLHQMEEIERTNTLFRHEGMSEVDHENYISLKVMLERKIKKAV